MSERLTIGEIAEWRSFLWSIFAGERANIEKINALCDMALQSLQRPDLEAALRKIAAMDYSNAAVNACAFHAVITARIALELATDPAAQGPAERPHGAKDRRHAFEDGIEGKCSICGEYTMHEIHYRPRGEDRREGNDSYYGEHMQQTRNNRRASTDRRAGVKHSPACAVNAFPNSPISKVCDCLTGLGSRCQRAHPHENMNAECLAKTEEVRRRAGAKEQGGEAASVGADQGGRSYGAMPTQAHQQSSLHPTPPAAAQGVEPVAWAYRAANTGKLCGVTLNEEDIHDLDPKWIVPLYLAPPAPAEAGQWFPIESAPKGKKVLLAYQNKLGNWRRVLGQGGGSVSAFFDTHSRACFCSYCGNSYDKGLHYGLNIPGAWRERYSWFVIKFGPRHYFRFCRI